MRTTRFIAALAVAMVLVCGNASASLYQLSKISDSVYAAIAVPNGRAASNAFFVVTEHEVVLAGAHFIPEGVKELLADIAEITPLPVNKIILTHHHKGFNYLDFDFPEKSEVIASVNVWQSLKGESREFKNPAIVFENALTLNRGKTSLVIINAGPGHSTGDVFVYLPTERVLFASDLLFNDSVGFMGEASIHEWGESLDVSIERFRKFYRAFMTEIIRNVEKGNTFAQTKKEFSLPQFKSLPGYDTFLSVNLERAFKQFKSSR